MPAVDTLIKVTEARNTYQISLWLSDHSESFVLVRGIRTIKIAILKGWNIAEHLGCDLEIFTLLFKVEDDYRDDYGRTPSQEFIEEVVF